MGRLHRHAPAAMQQQDGQGQSQADTAPTATDLTHRFLGAARALAIPARYVTGYLWHEGAGRFHAWAEAWDDGLGWIGFDPLLDLCPAECHVRLASGLDAFGTMPIRAVPGWSEMPAETVEIAVR
jgi:transglutaminase-like putative cysteine protease